MRTAVVIGSVLLVSGIAWTIWRMVALQSHPPVLEVRLEDAPSGTFFAGTPVILGVYLSGAPDAPSLSIGRPGRPWYSLKPGSRTNR
jgi:hypothetical protein